MNVERVRSYLTTNPTAYAGLRALDVSTQGREQSVAEGDEIPFIFSVVFIPMIIAYTLLKRLIYRFKRGLAREKPDPDPLPDHLFVMTSSYEYRTYAFEEVGARLRENNTNVMFLCSPSAANQMEDWQQNGFQTESFRGLLRFVSVSDLFVTLVRSIIAMHKLRLLTSGEFQESSLIYALNSIFLEYIKFSSLGPLVKDDPVVHTYSLMPYQVRATVPEHLYVYQHGTQRSPADDAWAAISFFPATILVWGEAWVENFDPLLPPDTEICVTGSPWHDYLSESIDSTPSDWDILFIGGSQVTTHSGKWEERYKQLVTTLVEACENNGWSLAIKLHPVESSDWYRDHGWGSYVVEFDSIRDGLNNADIAVTHYSSAFVESIALGTPIILNEEFSFGLSKLRPIAGATFVDSDELEAEIRRVRESGFDSDSVIETSQLLNVGGSVDQILGTVVDDS